MLSLLRRMVPQELRMGMIVTRLSVATDATGTAMEARTATARGSVGIAAETGFETTGMLMEMKI